MEGINDPDTVSFHNLISPSFNCPPALSHPIVNLLITILEVRHSGVSKNLIFRDSNYLPFIPWHILIIFSYLCLEYQTLHINDI